MRHKGLLYLLGGILLAALVYGLVKPAPAVELVIFHTNDHHGYCWSKKDKGGLAKQFTLVKEARAKFDNVLVLSGGDINTGYPESDVNQAEPSFRGMGRIGFDAMAVGNHEFDVSLPILRQQEAWGGFPFLSANIYYKNRNERVFTPYIIKEVGTLKLAILGLTTEETAYIAKFVEGLEFRNPVEEAKKLIPELKAKADIIIALTHMGYYSDRHHPVVGQTDPKLAEANPDIDVIVGGHSHTLLKTPIKVGKTLILQAYQYAKSMGELHLVISRKKVIGTAYKMHDLDESISEDPEMVALLQPYLNKAKVLFDKKVGTTLVHLDGKREHVRSRETNLGNLITDIFRDVTKAEIAFQNGGGIRSSISKGEVSFRNVRQAFPFNNTIVVLQLKGQDLLDVLNRSASLPRPAGGFLQVSGMSFSIKGDHIENVKVNGKPLELDRVYSVATNDFVANGGDGYEILKGKPKVDTGFILSGALKTYLRSAKAVSPKVEGRIRVQ